MKTRFRLYSIVVIDNFNYSKKAGSTPTMAMNWRNSNNYFGKPIVLHNGKNIILKETENGREETGSYLLQVAETPGKRSRKAKKLDSQVGEEAWHLFVCNSESVEKVMGSWRAVRSLSGLSLTCKGEGRRTCTVVPRRSQRRALIHKSLQSLLYHGVKDGKG